MNDPSHLLVTSSTYPLRPGDSIPRFVHHLADGLADCFERVHALAPAAPGAAATETMDRVLVHRHRYAWPARWQTLCYGYGMLQNLRKQPLTAALIPGFVLSQAAAIRRLCRTYPITIVNSHWLIFQGLAAALARGGGRFRHVAHVHAAEVYTLLRLPRALGRPLTRFILRHTDHVICESHFVRDKLDELAGFASGASISCMGVHAGAFAAAAATVVDDPTLLFFGRFVEKKGVIYLLQAMPAVRAAVPGASLRIVGDGILAPELHRAARDLPLPAGAVTFLGARPHREIIELLKTTSVVAVPSIVDSRGETEGMPTVLLEAMAAGKRVVASRVNGTPDVVRHLENGWLCNPKDPADLAAKLVEALRDRDPARIAAARQTAAYYDWPVLCRRYAGYLRATAK